MGDGTFLPLFLQSLLIVKVERLFALGTISSVATESTEKRLVAAEEVLRVRLCVSCATLLSVEDEDCTEGSASQYADDLPLGLDEKRPKGSGERGIIGESSTIVDEAYPK